MSLFSSLISGQLAAELKVTGSEELKTSWALIREEKHVRRLVNFPIRRGWMCGSWLGNGQKSH